LAIDKAMTPLEDEGGEAVSVDLGFPISTTDLPDGGAVISFGEDLVHDVAFDDNLAEHMGPRALAALSSELLACVEADRMSRQDWERTYMQGLDLLGLRAEDRSTPWPGACGVFHPILAEAAVRFQASSIMEVWPASGPAKVAVVGKVDDKKQRQAERVQADLNYFLTEVMTEARSEHERLLWALPLAGAAFKKTYYDPTLGRPVSMFVPAEDFIIPYGATDLQSAPRYTHTLKRYGNEIRKLQVAGFYRDIDLPEPTADYSDIEKKRDQLSGDSPSVDYDDRHTLLEVHAELDLEGFEDPDGIALPYVVTIDKSSSLVLAVRRNWAEDDLRKAKRCWFTQYTYIPGWGIYGLGLIHLIGGIAKSSTSILRQLVDAGTLSNLPAGLKSRGLRIKGDSSPLMPGEFRDVDVPSGSIRDAITFLPFKEPSQVLAGLLNQLVEEGRRFASIADLEIGDGNQQAPVGTTLALMERAMKVMSAVQARLHASMHGELKLLTELIHENGSAKYEYEVDEAGATRAQDYDGRIDVLPVSDPNATTMSQRVMQYQAALQLSAQAPQMYDMPELHRQMLGVLGLKDIGKIIPSSEEKKPMDPVAENMAVLTGKPVRAFLYQDHEAHIKVHTAAMQDPKVMQLMGQNPNAPGIMAAAQAHITEHIAMAYRRAIEDQMGVALPDDDTPIPEEIEVRLSRLVAEAADRVLQKNTAEHQAEVNQKAQQDPLVQMQQQELQLKAGELQRKQAKDQADAAEAAARLQQDDRQAAQRLQVERERIASQAQQTGTRLGVESARARSELEAHQREAGAKLGVDIAKSREELQVKRAEIAAKQHGTGVELGVRIGESRAQNELTRRQHELQARQRNRKPAK
jgi:hypothetical protein